MRILRRLLWVAVFVVLLVIGWNFRIANDITVRFDYLIGHSEAQPLWKVVLGTFLAGAVCASLPLLWLLARSGLLARRYRKTVARLETEVHELRTLPLGVEGPGRAIAAGSEAPPAGGASRAARGG
ncbi:MAG TPA: LapA family protein [Myxococcota bacterium]|jgi:uncharacterized membrane protein YciS (DUF1049 family)|nr:LapA family protein [Myxococcota bacterium]